MSGTHAVRYEQAIPEVLRSMGAEPIPRCACHEKESKMSEHIGQLIAALVSRLPSNSATQAPWVDEQERFASIVFA